MFKPVLKTKKPPGSGSPDISGVENIVPILPEGRIGRTDDLFPASALGLKRGMQTLYCFFN